MVRVHVMLLAGVCHERQRLLQRGSARQRLLLVIANQLCHRARQRIPIPPARSLAAVTLCSAGPCISSPFTGRSRRSDDIALQLILVISLGKDLLSSRQKDNGHCFWQIYCHVLQNLSNQLKLWEADVKLKALTFRRTESSDIRRR